MLDISIILKDTFINHKVAIGTLNKNSYQVGQLNNVLNATASIKLDPLKVIK